MSDGLHHVAPASFFPTAKELSSGLQWFKEHPILAAAAATAVSVITYLNTADDSDFEADARARTDLVSVAEEIQSESGNHPTSNQYAVDFASASGHDHAPPTLTRRRASSPSVLAATADLLHAKPTLPPRRTTMPASSDRTTPPALRKPGSEGKMSPAVSWVDEHGGSLTQVFEHLTTVDDVDDYDGSSFPDLEGPLRSGALAKASRAHGRPPTPRRPTCTSDEANGAEENSHATTPSGHWMGSLGVQSPQLGTPTTLTGDRQTESPQWGWYVPITPPQDHVPSASGSSSSSLSRAVVAPSSTSKRSTAITAAPTLRPPSAVPNASVQLDAVSATSAMRRSASGRIKAA